MQCPFCQEDKDRVVDSRASGSAIRRRRECLACGKRYTTCLTQLVGQQFESLRY